LQVVLQSIVVSKVLYAQPTWGGYVSRENISCIDKMVHKARRYSLTSMSHCFEDLLEQVDNKLLSCAVCCDTDNDLYHSQMDRCFL